MLAVDLQRHVAKSAELALLKGRCLELILIWVLVAAEDVAEFVAQNLLPLVTLMTGETLRPVKEDGRPVVVAVLDSDSTPETKHFIKKLKMAAPAYRKFVFTYVVGPGWPEFLRPFSITKDTKLPIVFVWVDDTFVMVSLQLTSSVFTKKTLLSRLRCLLHVFLFSCFCVERQCECFKCLEKPALCRSYMQGFACGQYSLKLVHCYILDIILLYFMKI